MSKTLLIFIKNPELGKAKTRLAKNMGDQAALAAYLELLEEAKKYTYALSGIQCQLWYSDFIDNTDTWNPEYYQKRVQKGTNLGERMAFAFESAFAEGATHVVIIGSDCPYLKAEDLQTAFKALGRYDTVLGPSSDGGYYLLGLQKMEKTIFEHMVWSTETVAEETKKRLRLKGLNCAVLPILEDIDEVEGWEKWKKYSVGRIVP